MRSGNILALGFGALLLSACATPYQEMGLLGGVAATRITTDTVQVSAKGNAYTDPDAIQRYAFRKAAEATLSYGFDNFEILSDQNRSTRGQQSTVVASGNYRSAVATGTSWEMIKPGQTFMIKMTKGPLPADHPNNQFDAHDVIANLGVSETRDQRDCREVEGKVQCSAK
jgi:hypothetical protein